MLRSKIDDVARATRHGTCVCRNGQGVLLLGPTGAGKSDLALRLIDRGFDLVADDRVLVEQGMARPPDVLAGLLEVRGVGILRLRPRFPVPLRLVVHLAAAPERLPAPMMDEALGVPSLSLSPFEASAAAKLVVALDCVLGERTLAAGFVVPDLQQEHGGIVTDT